VVWEVEVDGSAGEHDGGEGGFGGVESVGASDDEPDFVVEAFVAAVGQSAVDSGVDSVAVLADRAPGLDELGDTAALRAGAQTVEEIPDGSRIEVTGEHLTQGFLHLVGAPEDPAGPLYLPQRLGLRIGEIPGVFQAAPSGRP
jgi:hypothetical protein